MENNNKVDKTNKIKDVWVHNSLSDWVKLFKSFVKDLKKHTEELKEDSDYFGENFNFVNKNIIEIVKRIKNKSIELLDFIKNEKEYSEAIMVKIIEKNKDILINWIYRIEAVEWKKVEIETMEVDKELKTTFWMIKPEKWIQFFAIDKNWKYNILKLNQNEFDFNLIENQIDYQKEVFFNENWVPEKLEIKTKNSTLVFNLQNDWFYDVKEFNLEIDLDNIPKPLT